MASAAFSIGFKLLEIGLKLGGVLGDDGGVSEVRKDIKNAVSEIKNAIEDSKSQIMTAVGEAVAQRDYDECLMKIQRWIDAYQKTVVSAVNESGNGEGKRVEPSEALKSNLGNDDTGIETTLYRMHGILMGVQSSKMSLIQLAIKGNFAEPLYSAKIEHQENGIPWFLKAVSKYLETQFKAQAGGFALLCLYQGKTADIDEIKRLASDRFKAQEAVAWEVMPQVIKLMKKDWVTPMSPTHFWRFEKADNANHWLAIGEWDELWHGPDVNGPHTQWRFTNKEYKPVSLEEENQVYVVSRSYPTCKCVIKERFSTPALVEGHMKTGNYRYLLENPSDMGNHFWLPVASLNDQVEQNALLVTLELSKNRHLWSGDWPLAHRLDQVPVLIKVAPVKDTRDAQFCLIPVASSLTKFKGHNDKSPRTEIYNKGIFNTAMMLTDKDVDQGPLRFNYGFALQGNGPDGSFPGY